jgi:hypothetical protein
LRHKPFAAPHWWRRLVPARIDLAPAQRDVRLRSRTVGRSARVASLPLAVGPSEVTLPFASGSTGQARKRAGDADPHQRSGALATLISRRLLDLATRGADSLDLLRDAIDSLQRSARRLELDSTRLLQRRDVRKKRAAVRELRMARLVAQGYSDPKLPNANRHPLDRGSTPARHGSESSTSAAASSSQRPLGGRCERFGWVGCAASPVSCRRCGVFAGARTGRTAGSAWRAESFRGSRV